LEADPNKDFAGYYEQLRQEVLSSSLDKVRAKFRGAGILVSSGVAGWIEVINDIYAPINEERPMKEPGPKSPTTKTNTSFELTNLLTEITMKNLCQEIHV
jgi:hypothetical protein